MSVDPNTGNTHEFIDESAGILNAPFTLAEIEDSISNLVKGKSCGPDGIPAEFYKYTLHDIAPVLLILFNKILSTGQFPNAWGHSIITPIYKSGSTDNPSNYRGISITNTLYKVFSDVINKRLYSWAEEFGKIDESQAGFRQGYSAVDKLCVLFTSYGTEVLVQEKWSFLLFIRGLSKGIR